MKQKILLTIDGVSFYTSANAIKRGIGQDVSINTAAQQVYNELMEYRKSVDGILNKTCGCGGTNYSGHTAQINLV